MYYSMCMNMYVKCVFNWVLVAVGLHQSHHIKHLGNGLLDMQLYRLLLHNEYTYVHVHVYTSFESAIIKYVHHPLNHDTLMNVNPNSES